MGHLSAVPRRPHGRRSRYKRVRAGAARLLLPAALALLACMAHAKDPGYRGTVHTLRIREAVKPVVQLAVA